MTHDKRLPADVRERLATLGEKLADCPGVVFAYLFGSAAANALTPLSDIDIAVYLGEGTDLLEARLGVIEAAAKHLGTDEIDVVVLNRAPTALAGRILGSRHVIVDRSPFDRHRFESLALREFFDFRVLEREVLAARDADG